MAGGEVSPRTQAERRSQSEEALLDAAAEAIAERGVERASLARIGGRAGASRGLPSHHFGSKDALVARLARRAQDQIDVSTLAALRTRHPSVDELTPLELLRASVDSYLEMFAHPTADQRALIVMWGSTFPAGSSVEGMVEADRRGYEGLTALISRGQREGSIKPDIEPTAAAVVVLGMMRGVAALLLTDSELTDMGSVRATCHDWITAALATVPASGRRGKGDRTPQG